METKTCAKCGYKWIPRTEEPKTCPQCKQAKINEPYKIGPRKKAVER